MRCRLLRFDGGLFLWIDLRGPAMCVGCSLYGCLQAGQGRMI